MTHKTAFTTADFVILKIVKKMKNNNFFLKKEKSFLLEQNFADAN